MFLLKDVLKRDVLKRKVYRTVDLGPGPPHTQLGSICPAGISTRLQSNLEKRSISPMTPAPKKAKITDGALRAAKQIERDASFIESTAEIIDRETGVRELVEILENIIAEAGDLIEGRSPELVAQARAALRHFSDESPRRAE